MEIVKKYDSLEDLFDKGERINVFTYEHEGIIYVFENISSKKPHKVIGKLLKELGDDYKGNDQNVVRLHIRSNGPFVKVEPIPQELERKILGNW
ncbi:hypothetical protein HYX17_02915 [Candidatus Woesearchaeota archaeon]|nr:hypothetical protein [Candidatus Woesearchaeota archaeon]